jgi:Tol biopolymer transport system component
MRRLAAMAALSAVGGLAAAAALAAPGATTRVSVADNGAQSTAQSDGMAFSADGRFVAFTSTAKLTAADPGGKLQLYVRDRLTGHTLLASSSAAGVPANDSVDEDNINVPYALSGDGRYAVFASTATNLVPNDGNGAKKDVLRKDLDTGQVVLVNVNAAGQQPANGVFGDPDVSYDGSRVVFVDDGGAKSDLFPGDANNAQDIVLRDISAGTTTLVSQNTAGQEATLTSERPSISADGKVVSFEQPTDDTTMIPGDANAASDILVRNLVTRTTVQATIATDGTRPGGASFSDLSGDGRDVVWSGGGKFDPANDANGANDVYRRDLVTGTTTLVSTQNDSSAAGNQGGERPVISADGSRVAFQSASTDLVVPDANAANADVYVRDVATRTTTRGSTTSAGVQLTNPSTRAGISGNGGAVGFLFADAGQPMVPGDANAFQDVFVKELAPTDATGPPLALSAPADAATTTDPQVTVSGVVGADPSGVVGATLNGAPLVLGAGGSFSATVPLGPGATTLTVRALDGAGNTSSAARTVTRSIPTPAGVAAAPPLPPAKATGLRVVRRGSLLVVRFRLTGAARVTALLLRPVRLRTKTPRTRYLTVARRGPVSLFPGLRRLTIKLPKRLAPARYQVRVAVVGPTAITQASRPLVASKPGPKRPVAHH